MATVGSPKVHPYAIGQQTLGSPSVTKGRPLTLSDMGVSTGLTLNAINRKLEIESTLDDVFENSLADTVYVGKKVPLPNAIFMKLTAQASGSRTVTVPFLRAQTGIARMGNAEQQLGFERDMNLSYGKFYYNEYSYAIAGAEWGVDYNDVSQFGIYSEIQPQISKVMAELDGMWKREALLETYSAPLEQAPVSLTQEWNNNWFIANLGFGSQPTYDPTLASFTSNIVSALSSAATGTAGVNANIDLDYLLALEHYAANTKRINPLMIGGQKRYVVLLPSSQLFLLLSNSEGQLGDVWVQTAALAKEEQSYPGVVGRVKSLLIVEDQRYPTITEATGTITPAYVQPGNQDSRNTSVYNSSSNKSWDVGFLLGAPALCKWDVRPLHFEMEKTEFGKVYAKGAFAEGGTQLVKYDIDSETTTSRKNYGSIVLALSAANIVTTA